MSECIPELIREIHEGRCLLFLGAGSSLMCESPQGGGLTGEGLANEMIKHLGEDLTNFKGTLQEMSEYIESHDPQQRRALEKYVYDRLSGLRPTVGHILLTLYPWKAIITTNYNTAIEEGYNLAKSMNIGSKICKPLRTDRELNIALSSTSSEIPLFKPHGCLSNLQDRDAPLVLTPEDYYKSTKSRVRIYEKIIDLGKEYSTLFVGYSLTDYNFNNIYYELQDRYGKWLPRSYTVIPVPSHKQKYMIDVYTQRKIRLIDDKFDTFFIKLTEVAGILKGGVYDETLNMLSKGDTIKKLGENVKGLPKKLIDDLKLRNVDFGAIVV